MDIFTFYKSVSRVVQTSERAPGARCPRSHHTARSRPLILPNFSYKLMHWGSSFLTTISLKNSHSSPPSPSRPENTKHHPLRPWVVVDTASRHLQPPTKLLPPIRPPVITTCSDAHCPLWQPPFSCTTTAGSHFTATGSRLRPLFPAINDPFFRHKNQVSTHPFLVAFRLFLWQSTAHSFLTKSDLNCSLFSI